MVALRSIYFFGFLSVCGLVEHALCKPTETIGTVDNVKELERISQGLETTSLRDPPGSSLTEKQPPSSSVLKGFHEPNKDPPNKPASVPEKNSSKLNPKADAKLEHTENLDASSLKKKHWARKILDFFIWPFRKLWKGMKWFEKKFRGSKTQSKDEKDTKAVNDQTRKSSSVSDNLRGGEAGEKTKDDVSTGGGPSNPVERSSSATGDPLGAHELVKIFEDYLDSVSTPDLARKMGLMAEDGKYKLYYPPTGEAILEDDQTLVPVFIAEHTLHNLLTDSLMAKLEVSTAEEDPKLKPLFGYLRQRLNKHKHTLSPISDMVDEFVEMGFQKNIVENVFSKLGVEGDTKEEALRAFATKQGLKEEDLDALEGLLKKSMLDTLSPVDKRPFTGSSSAEPSASPVNHVPVNSGTPDEEFLSSVYYLAELMGLKKEEGRYKVYVNGVEVPINSGNRENDLITAMFIQATHNILTESLIKRLEAVWEQEHPEQKDAFNLLFKGLFETLKKALSSHLSNSVKSST
ncbi:hypothetical protein CROQUDRAFT_135141 [Cronartium quercuum f. sp. fusiforme G11]|uniref:Ubiquitin-conjugating enzyme C-terminal fungi domain-containing protein n=1 Tax=Cronartium quercuum f. sp. fusiforme G11 TaxID=708437 RepID=A0A9P6T923_9BASI|nr:hypothetical protein CROQUDRAFT_135141 [Cronartium quercuum f. sp. fusiforme G11]